MNDEKIFQEIEQLKKEVADLKASRGLRGFLRRAFSKSSFIIGIAVAAALTGFLAWAAQNTFSDGTVISADAVNNNFNELYAAKWGVNGTDFYYNGGNVGIGTNTPVEKLEVNGSLKSGQIKAQGFFKVQNGSVYNATPVECINLCSSNGGRLATVSELYEYAVGGNDLCGYMWVIDTATGSASAGYPLAGYPMYHNQTSSGCGATGTGDVPRVYLSSSYEWATTTKYDCACYGIK